MLAETQSYVTAKHQPENVYLLITQLIAFWWFTHIVRTQVLLLKVFTLCSSITSKKPSHSSAVSF